MLDRVAGDAAQPRAGTVRTLLQAGPAPGAAPPRSDGEAARIALAVQRIWWPVVSARFEGRGDPGAALSA